MWSTRVSVPPIAATIVLLASACGTSDSTGPGGGQVTCQPDDPVCPPVDLASGFSGPSGSPSIAPTSFSGTAVDVTASSFPVVGTTSSTTNGYWLLVIDNELRSYGVLAVGSSTFVGDIPLFCGSQTVLLTFDNTSGRAYYRATVTRLDCTTPQFRVQLTWDTGPDSDIDLHLLRPGGDFGGDNDCYWFNCQGTALEWGAAGPDGDPILDVDDVQGYGPENIYVASGAEAGEYRVVIHNFDDSPATRATVRLYFDDIEAARYTSEPLDSPSNTYWEVARVRITTKQITPVDAYSGSPPPSAVAASAAPVK